VFVASLRTALHKASRGEKQTPEVPRSAGREFTVELQRLIGVVDDRFTVSRLSGVAATQSAVASGSLLLVLVS